MAKIIKISKKDYKTFDDIKNIDEYGVEFWYARELATLLEYNQWRNFNKVIDRARIACDNSGHNIRHDFAEVSKIVKAGATTKSIIDYKLSRYACYLIVQNADPRKKAIALGQTYFAIQTYRQEINDKYNELSEDRRRLILRGDIKQWNQLLVDSAHDIGVVDSKDIGGTMPEDLPTPKKSIKQIEKEHMRKLKEKSRKNVLELDE